MLPDECISLVAVYWIIIENDVKVQFKKTILIL